jgi:hypothetical protein
MAYQFYGTLRLPAHARCSSSGQVVLVHVRQRDLLVVLREEIQDERQSPVRVSEPTADID